MSRLSSFVGDNGIKICSAKSLFETQSTAKLDTLCFKILRAIKANDFSKSNGHFSLTQTGRQLKHTHQPCSLLISNDPVDSLSRSTTENKIHLIGLLTFSTLVLCNNKRHSSSARRINWSLLYSHKLHLISSNNETFVWGFLSKKFDSLRVDDMRFWPNSILITESTLISPKS